jgi:hypothetical protein
MRRLTPKLEFERHQWLMDHEKRLEDAIVAQYGRDDEDSHADGVHRLDGQPWRRR